MKDIVEDTEIKVEKIDDDFKVSYTNNGIIYSTKCPFGMKKENSSEIGVVGYDCYRCKKFIGQNRPEKFILCKGEKNE